MFLATINKKHRLLHTSYICRVTVPDLERGYEELKTLVQEFPDGFIIFADLGRMEYMDPACANIIGQTMELFDHSGLERVVRLFPDPTLDIGLNIIAVFHYSNRRPVVTCDTMKAAIRELRLK
jgi:PAS domain-containing protein